MANYNNFDQILRDKKLNESAKNGYVKRWLKTTYDINIEDNPDFFTELSRVHDHDKQPLHFGRLLLDTAFGTVWVQLVRNQKNQRWRIALFHTEDDPQPVILSPVNSANAVDHGELQQFKSLLTAPQRGAGNGDGDFANLDMYTNPGLSPEDHLEQYQQQVAPYVIPAYLYDPTYHPGTDAGRQDASLNLNFEEIIARWAAAADTRSTV